MKRSLLIAFVLLFGANIVTAQPPGSIGLFVDPGGTICDVYDQLPGLVTVYVVHMYTPGATGSRFMVNHWSWGAALIHLGETVTPPYIGIGSYTTGITIGYNACVPSPNMIMKLDFFGNGISATCSYIQVVPDPLAVPPGIYVMGCTAPLNWAPATGGDVVVNPDPSCMCDIPVQETTWGRVKALYQ